MTTYLVSYELVDAYGRSARKAFETADLVDFSAALTAASGMGADLAGLSELDVLSYTVSQRVPYTDTVVPGANRDEGVTFVLRKEDNKKASIKVPGPINAIFDGLGNADITDGAVTAFLANFLTGGDFVFSDGEQATVILSGVLDK